MTIRYFGITRGDGNDPNKIVYTSGSSNNTEMEFSFDDTKGLTRNDIFQALEVFDQYFQDSSKSTVNAA